MSQTTLLRFSRHMAELVVIGVNFILVVKCYTTLMVLSCLYSVLFITCGHSM